MGPSRKELLDRLSRWRGERRLPITLGRASPKAIVCLEGGVFRLCPLIAEPEELERIVEERSRAGYYMPEHTWQALRPGPPLLEERTKAAFLAALRALTPWPYDDWLGRLAGGG